LKKIKLEKKAQKKEKKIDKRDDIEKAYDNATLAILRKKTVQDLKKAAGEDTTPNEQDVADKLAKETAKELGFKEHIKKVEEDKKDEEKAAVIVKKSI
jgi:hypothetical protein